MVSEKTVSACQRDLTPPNSPNGDFTQPRAKDLKKLLEKVLSKFEDPPNSPVYQENYQLGPDAFELQILLAQFIRGKQSPTVAGHTQSCSDNSGQGSATPLIGEVDLSPPICTTPTDFKSFEKWASKSQFKTVLETWDKEACKYKIAESVDTSGGLDDYAECAFVVRERVDRNSEEVMPYVDIKSEGLRAALREVLHEIKAMNLMEDKPSIEQNILFHFLPELERYADLMENGPDHGSAHAQHLRLLIDHLKHTYVPIMQRLRSMLQHGHITYDLLWALFKPGCHIYTTCIGTKEPRCVVFDAGEELTQHDETWFNLECRFLDYDGVKFGEAGIFLRVPKFRGSKPIATLKAYPLRHHPSHEQVRKDLVERGQRFRDFAGSHTQHYNGSAFFISKGKAIKVNINSRVAVDARFFHEMQPNYSRPSLRDMVLKEKDGITFFDIGVVFMEEREQEKEKIRGDVECAVSALRDVNWSPESFDYLGPPGVGKTFTVEAISEYFKLSLYSISAGELVVDYGDSNALEQQLGTIFKIAHHFKAVLLLDEADAFMEQRTSYHNTHNRLVTVFL
ncbi:ATPase AAA-type core [Penicillium malachiteum]|uniref:ATPase AAA-type core n=1 Tax=Penicillium malachiteum TaxID=1324776 RepID=UPI002549B69F|nr:ATPase AAA-type core [Penicillium malachiteum]KAJ5713146.1 ATPase AAA-type core [Penicillium malachiteum]